MPPQYWPRPEVLAESSPTDVSQRIGHDPPRPRENRVKTWIYSDSEVIRCRSIVCRNL